MSLDSSTMNVLLVAVIGLQSWIVREVFLLKAQISILNQKLERK